MLSSESLVKVTGNVHNTIDNLGIQKSVRYLLIDGLLEGRQLEYCIVTVRASSGVA
jgi:hypothetical protein